MTLYLLVLLTSAAVTYVATPLARRLAERWGAVTPVRERDVHSVPVPRLGGLAMLAGVTVSFLVASGTPFFDRIFSESGAPWGILGAAALMCTVGVLDDIWDLDSLTKLAGQVLAAGLMAWQGVQLVTLPLAGVTLGSGGLFLALTVLAVVVTVNAVNFVDGLDGLAAGIIGIGGAAFFVYTYMLTRQASPSDFSSLAAVVAAALVGCCVGFLPHNLHPARIFMGDSGALLLGLLLAASVVAVTGQVDPTMVSDAQIVPAFFPVLMPLAMLLVPMADLVLAVVRRLGRGQSPFTADRRHLHHRLLDLGHSHARAVGVMYLWTAVLSFGAVATAFVPLRWWLPVFLAVVAASLVLTLGPMRGRRAGPPAPAAPAGAAPAAPGGAAPAAPGGAAPAEPGGASTAIPGPAHSRGATGGATAGGAPTGRRW